MPSESTKFNAIFNENGREQGEEPIAFTNIAVGWGKEAGEVQISVLHEAFDHKTGQSLTAITADRHAINRLIRTLRKARDQAMGRDE